MFLFYTTALGVIGWGEEAACREDVQRAGPPASGVD